ncbi:hypothetical protein [uncultured Chryseobacterium sp.]|uniref:hypothetical protein n=1 Tax=uncultured Chryseobacterium sp. TaxID=259322 RepID=UPI0025F334DB|nr:hypothetical protein [uncultured Chryseobacterium sp.]
MILRRLDNNLHCFLRTYRSFYHSYHRKYEESETEVLNYLNKFYGRDVYKVTQGAKLALQDLEIPKKRLDEILINKNYEDLEYYCYEYPYRCPVSCAGVSTPGHFKNGNPFNLSNSESISYSDFFTTVLTFA